MKTGGVRSAICQRCLLEALEPRELLSAAYTPAVSAWKKGVGRAYTTLEIQGKRGRVTPHTGSPGNALTPAQVRAAYSMNNVMFGNIVGDGTGQTIAIIDAYAYPTAYADLQAFDLEFGLADPPSFKRVDQYGGTNYPAEYNATYNANYGWQLEAALDIQWAHAMAPGANIVLVECNSSFMSDLVSAGVNWARQQSSISVVSMSFGANEFGSEIDFDSYFTSSYGHGVTFVASTGDAGQPGGYPAFSPNVVGVGGTTLTLNAGEYLSETGWAGSGGGISTKEGKPSYQANITQSSTNRTSPDVSMVADPATGVAVYSTFHQAGWLTVGGTSLSAPLFAGLMAVVNQGRALVGLGSLDGATETLPKLYGAGSENFHDIVSGYNGFSAEVGYDLVTGLGTPIGNLLVNELAGSTGSISGHVYSDNNGDGVFSDGDAPLSGVTVYVDQNNNGVFDVGGSQSYASGTINLAIPDFSATGVTSTLTAANFSSSIVSVTVTLMITHARDNNLSGTLIGPDGTQVVLFSGVGGMFGQNFSNTTFTDTATIAITAGVADFKGAYRPISPLSVFNGKPANGAWKLVVKDTVFNRTGTVNSWSLSIKTFNETGAISGADGSYTLGPVVGGNYDLRTVTPAGYVDTTVPHAAYNVFGAVTAAEFTQMPVAFSPGGPSESFYLWLDGAALNISRNGTATNPAYQLPMSKISSLTFHLTTPGAKLVVDYATGDVVPLGGLIVDGGGLDTSELYIIGGGVPLSFTDTQVHEVDGPGIGYSGLGGITFYNSEIYFNGTLENLKFINLEGATSFQWGG